jgi:hypothetical protein
MTLIVLFRYIMTIVRPKKLVTIITTTMAT